MIRWRVRLTMRYECMIMCDVCVRDTSAWRVHLGGWSCEVGEYVIYLGDDMIWMTDQVI